MTPLDFAQNLAKSEDRGDVVLGVSIVVRGLTDEDPSDPLRMPWPMGSEVVRRAATFLGVTLTPEEIGDVFEVAPAVSDAVLNRH